MTTSRDWLPRNPLDHEPVAVIYARKQAGLSQIETARQAGISKQLMCDIEAGRRNATPAVLKKLAEVFNCPRVVLERKRIAPTEGEVA